MYTSFIRADLYYIILVYLFFRRIRKVSGPVVLAENIGGAAMYELVRVGGD